MLTAKMRNPRGELVIPARPLYYRSYMASLRRDLQPIMLKLTHQEITTRGRSESADERVSGLVGLALADGKEKVCQTAECATEALSELEEDSEGRMERRIAESRAKRQVSQP
jgi:hypothetical protein